jgi:spermidine synthase
LFALTLFVSALLLFLVQPLIARMILPLLGGSPAVWNTCMVFFQAALLAGYLYAHCATTFLRPRHQVMLHAGLLLLPLLFLPIGVAQGWAPSGDANPIPWLLGLLLASAGVPFVVVATSAPLLQKWFAATDHPGAKDPYFLYAASNLGSMVALLGYPTLLEPHMRLAEQSWLWSVGYGALAVLTVACAGVLWKSAVAGPGAVEKDADGDSAGPRPTWARRLHWIALAFVPSSLLLGVTSYLSTDIAAIPLLWVVPLGLYLLTFILAFAQLPARAHATAVKVMPVAVLAMLFLMISGIRLSSVGAVIALHLVAFFVVAWVCHGELARRRPAPRHLTEFYLLMSFGGVLGGLFNALLAPSLFKGVTEYALVLAASCLLLPPAAARSGWRRWVGSGLPALLAAAGACWLMIRMLGGFNPARVWQLLDGLFVRVVESGIDLGRVSRWTAVSPTWLVRALLVLVGAAVVAYVLARRSGRLSRLLDFVFALAVGIAAVGLILTWRTDYWDLRRLDATHPNPIAAWGKILAFALPLALCFLMRGRPARLGLSIGAVMLAGTFYELLYSDVLYRERGFFGAMSVEVRYEDNSVNLYHGTTLHGKQSREAARRREPLTYYHRTGPIGQVFSSYSVADAKRHVAVIGLGTGTLAAYGEAGQALTFYEIDPAIQKIAANPRFFTYMTDATARGVKLDVVLGDARLKLHEAPDGRYGLIVIDAFSSDAIPVHLLTREAVQLYLDKLEPGGLIALHISNRYLDLEPVLFRIAEGLGLYGLIQGDDGEEEPGKAASTWVLLARQPRDFTPLGRLYRNRWSMLAGSEAVAAWTDDFSNLLRVFKWR